MTVFDKDNKKVVFLHIPKTGGSSFTKLFEENGWSQQCIEGGHQHKILDQISVDWSCVETIFTVIRNPIDRVLSEIRGNENLWHDSWHDRCDEAMDRFFRLICPLHARRMSDFWDVSEQKDVKVFRFEDTEHRQKIKDMFDLKGAFPHEVGATYKSELNFTLTKSSEKMIKDKYREDFERFYPELL